MYVVVSLGGCGDSDSEPDWRGIGDDSDWVESGDRGRDGFRGMGGGRTCESFDDSAVQGGAGDDLQHHWLRPCAECSVWNLDAGQDLRGPPRGCDLGVSDSGCHYTAPVQDFLWFDGVLRDPVSGYTIGVDKTRQEIDDIDPQRFQSGWPNEVIPYAVNLQPGTFYGFPQFEIWPAPLNGFVYVGGYTRSGMPFVNLTDTVTPPLQEDIVIELASIKAYEWCLVNPDKCPKGDFRFAMGKADKKYNELLNKYMIMDEEISGRNVIPSQQGIGRSDMPWVSAAESIMYAP